MHDLHITGNSPNAISEIKRELTKMFEMEDCDKSKICLGLEIVWNKKLKLLKLKQEAYARKILSRFGMTESKAVNTPIEVQLDKAIIVEALIEEIVYAQAIRSLIYLTTCTSSHIAFVGEGFHSTWIGQPSHFGLVKRVLRYFRGTAFAGSVFYA